VSEVQVGPFRVRTERMRIEAYKQSIGASGEDVPAAFPIAWLAQPEIRAAIEQGCGSRLPLHEGQSFEYTRALEVDCEYRLTLTLNEEANPARLVLKCEVASPTGESCLNMETLLRLVAPAMEVST
jgi:hypothetical protein